MLIILRESISVSYLLLSQLGGSIENFGIIGWGCCCGC